MFIKRCRKLDTKKRDTIVLNSVKEGAENKVIRRCWAMLGDGGDGRDAECEAA